MAQIVKPNKLTVKAAQESAGKISAGNSKMPGSTFAISALHCNVGGKLAEIDGSVCSKCYAIRLQKLRPSVNQGWTANYEKATSLIANAPEKWVAACVLQIQRLAAKSGQPFHRWFDSGDLQSVEMLSAICEVARQTPEIAHWLPTREAGIVKRFKAQGGEIPDNLALRVSSTMVGDAPVRNAENTSTVHRKGQAYIGHECPAYKQGNACGDCRACWDKAVKNISYKLH